MMHTMIKEFTKWTGHACPTGLLASYSWESKNLSMKQHRSPIHSIETLVNEETKGPSTSSDQHIRMW